MKFFIVPKEKDIIYKMTQSTTMFILLCIQADILLALFFSHSSTKSFSKINCILHRAFPCLSLTVKILIYYVPWKILCKKHDPYICFIES